MNQFIKYILSVFLCTLSLISTTYAKYKLQINNNSLQTISVNYNNSKLKIINPGTSWISNSLEGQLSFDILNYGIITLLDIGADHITGDDPSLYYGVLITYQDMDIVGRYSSRIGGLLISVGKYGDVSLSGHSFENTIDGMMLSDVDINRLTHQ